MKIVNMKMQNNKKNSNPARQLLGSPLVSFSCGYGAGQQMRAALYARGILKVRRLPCKVISVGNLVSGGTGKTPMVEMVAALLRDRGYKVAVLSRGYGSKTHQPVALVSDEEKVLLSPSEAGDEPYLLARNLKGVPVLIGPNRYQVGRQACQRFRLDVALLDDGYQHLSLGRDLNILLLDATRPFGNGWVLPRGLLREPLRAMGRAQAIVFTRCQQPPPPSFFEGYARWGKGVPLFQSSHRADRLVRVTPRVSRGDDRSRDRKEAEEWSDGGAKDEEMKGPAFLQGKRVMAFCGLARPDSFRDLIAQLGGEVVHFHPFRDHQRYGEEELRQIGSLFHSSGAEMILTTEKDEVKLIEEPFPSELPLWSLRIRLEIQGDRKAFEELIFSTVSDKSRAPG